MSGRGSVSGERLMRMIGATRTGEGGEKKTCETTKNVSGGGGGFYRRPRRAPRRTFWQILQERVPPSLCKLSPLVFLASFAAFLRAERSCDG